MEFKEDLFVKWLSECKYRVRSEYKVYPEQLVAPGIISKAYMENKCWGSVTSLCILEISHRLQSPQGSAGRREGRSEEVRVKLLLFFMDNLDIPTGWSKRKSNRLVSNSRYPYTVAI